MAGVRVDRVVTSGTFSLDGGTWAVENNVWVVGDDDESPPPHAASTLTPTTNTATALRTFSLPLSMWPE